MDEQQQDQNQGIDANRVIDKLTDQNSEMSKSLAIVQVQYDDLYNAYVKQQELINAYKQKQEIDDDNEDNS